jgi:ribosome-binding factor A
MSFHDERVVSQLQRLTAEFLSREASGLSLITVTGVELLGNSKQALIKISVLPETEAESALNFTKRRRTELKHYIQEHLRIKRVPHLDFALDPKKE